MKLRCYYKFYILVTFEISIPLGFNKGDEKETLNNWNSVYAGVETSTNA